MPRVFRQQYTRPIPEGAERVTIKDKKGQPVPAVRFKGQGGKTITAPLTRNGDRCRLPSPTWYGRVGGQAVPLCTNKVAAEQMLADLVRKAELGKAGMADPYEAHRQRPLTEHLADYRKELEARGNDPRYVSLTASRLQDLLAGCGFTFTADLSASAVMDWLARLRRGRPRAELDPRQESFTRAEAAAVLGIAPGSIHPIIRRHGLAALGYGRTRRYPRATIEALQDILTRGASVETTNQYLTHLKGFCRWLVKDRRLAENPLSHLELGNVQVDRRHDRRELDAGELRRLLAAARDSARTFRGLTGPDRFHLYATACGTGFRAGALASLTPESFDLTSNTPTVTLAARKNKSRKLKIQPLPPDVAGLLRDYLRDRPAGRPVWDGTWAQQRVAADMLRIDLEAAGIPYAVDGPDGPLFVDFHALRHTYLTLGGRAGIDLRTLQELAGHSTPELTARYSHRRLHDLAGAVDKLPDFLPDQGPASDPASEAGTLQATGTDGGGPGAYTPLTQAADGERVALRLIDGGEGQSPLSSSVPNPLPAEVVEGGRGELTAADGGASDPARLGSSQIEKLANLDRIPRPYGFYVSCLPVKVKDASAGWCRAVALVPEG